YAYLRYSMSVVAPGLIYLNMTRQRDVERIKTIWNRTTVFMIEVIIKVEIGFFLFFEIFNN
ncbi:MAG: hypothetical protein SNJ56_05170, partial [Termitinemataceae bacterium]